MKKINKKVCKFDYYLHTCAQRAMKLSSASYKVLVGADASSPFRLLPLRYSSALLAVVPVYIIYERNQAKSGSRKKKDGGTYSSITHTHCVRWMEAIKSFLFFSVERAENPIVVNWLAASLFLCLRGPR